MSVALQLLSDLHPRSERCWVIVPGSRFLRVIVRGHKTCRPPLYFLDLIFQIFCVWVPNYAGIFQHRPNKANVYSRTSFEKNCFSAWVSTLNMGLINKVDMVCLSPVGYGVKLTFRALALRQSRLLRLLR